MNIPESGMKLIPTKTKMSDILLRYLYKVAWYMDAQEFTRDEEIAIVNYYARNYHPRRAGNELLELRNKSP